MWLLCMFGYVDVGGDIIDVVFGMDVDVWVGYCVVVLVEVVVGDGQVLFICFVVVVYFEVVIGSYFVVGFGLDLYFVGQCVFQVEFGYFYFVVQVDCQVYVQW